MNDFYIGISASVVGSFLFAVSVYFFSRKVRVYVFSKLNSLTLSGVEYVYPNRKSAEADICESLDKTDFVKIMSGRGHYFQADEYSNLFNYHKVYTKGIYVMLANPYFVEGYDWIKQREDELAKFDKSFGVDLHKKQIIGTIGFLLNHVKNKRISLKLNQHPIIGRIVITQDYLFFTPMKSGSHIRTSQTYKYNRSSDMYQHYYRLFDQVWDASYSLEDVNKRLKNRKDAESICE